MRPERRRLAGPGASADDLPALLRRGAAALALELDARATRRLLDYVALLHKWNAVYNLTAIRDPAQMLVQHVLDALAIVPPLRSRIDLGHASIADVGSGAGVPGLVLAIVEPTAHVTSIDTVGKKTAFQRQACAELALTNVNVHTGRAEAVSQRFDLITCRAFATLVDFADAAAPMSTPRTLLAAMKGQRAGLDDELRALPPGLVAEVEALQVPFLAAERHLVLMRHAPVPARPAEHP